MTELTTCPCCNGDGFLYREKDESAFYKRPVAVRVSRVCPYCHGKRKVEPPPVSGKGKAAQAEVDE
jgi:DnaJ-class molecular chaperone